MGAGAGKGRGLGYAAALALALGCASGGGGSSGGGAAAGGVGYLAPAEHWRFEFDGRDWGEGTQSREKGSAKETFVLPGQDDKSWTELVTTTLSFGAQRTTTVAAVAEQTRKELSKDCPSFQWSIVQELPSTVIYEWSRGLCKDAQPQHELARLSVGRLGIHKLSYSARTPRIPAGLRMMWIKRLRQASLEQRREDGPPASAPAGADAGAAAESPAR
jgi:hypothetical protein